MLGTLLYRTNSLGSLSQQFGSSKSQTLIMSIRNLTLLGMERLKSEPLSISIEEIVVDALSNPIILTPK